MSGPDKLSYDSTGAGDMVHSDAGEVMGGWSRPGGNNNEPSVGSPGPIPKVGGMDASPMDPRSTPPSNGVPAGGFATDGGSQRIP